MHKRKLNSYLPTLQKLFVSLSTWLVYCVCGSFQLCFRNKKQIPIQMFESPSRLSPPRSFFCCWLMTIIFSSSLWAASNVSWREGGARGWELRKYMHQKVSINKNNSVRYSLLGASPNKNHAVLRLGHGFSVMVWQGSRLCFVGAHEIYLETNNC